MKLKRRPRRVLSPENAGLMVALFHALEEGMESCSRLARAREAGVPLDEIRPEALRMARSTAYVGRVTWESMLSLKLLEELPEHLQPLGALKVLAQLGYSLAALAEDDPEPGTVLSPADVDGLIAKHDTVRWFEFYGDHIHAAEARHQ